MSPPVLGIKNSPTDPLKGLVNLNVVLPSGRNIIMTVKRSTPLMDLLVQIATANKISPGSHVIHATSVNGTISYKPSTPVGDLGPCILNVVPKNQISSTHAQKLKLVNTPFEQTFRLQVFLPRNQLYVTRISPKIKIADILTHVCSEKNLDPSKYSIRHPSNLGEVLDTNLCLVDYKLTQVALVSNPSRSVSMSSINVAELHSADRQINYSRTHSLNADFKNDNEASSEKSSHLAPPVIPTRPPKKRRPAPKPPQTSNQNITQVELLSGDAETTVISHSRNSSDSSGYHETSVLGESPETDYCFSEPLSCRNKLSSCPEMSQYQNLPNISRSLSNLTVVDNNLSKAPSIISHSVSTTCLPSAMRRKKKAPSPPPKFMMKTNTINEETLSSCSRPESESIPSDSEPSTPLCDMRSASQSCLNVVDPHEAKAATLPANAKLPDIQCVRQETKESDSLAAAHVGNVFEEGVKENVDGSTESSYSPVLSQLEIKMNDEEIDRIFNSATHGHESSANTPLSSLETTTLPPDNYSKERPISPALNTTQPKIQDQKKSLLSSQEEKTDKNVSRNEVINPSESNIQLTTHDDFCSQKLEADFLSTQDSSTSNVCSSNSSFDQPPDSQQESSQEYLPVEMTLTTLPSGAPLITSVTSKISLEETNSSTNFPSLASTSVRDSDSTSTLSVTHKNSPPTANINASLQTAVNEKYSVTNEKVTIPRKSPVIKELKAAISDQTTFKVKKSVPFKQPELKRSNSVLDNFKISAYHTIKKPIHILSDSLESSSFNDPYKESNVKKSLSIIYDQSAIFGRPLKPVQRSTSHVSLSTIESRNDLSFKSNLPTFKNLKSKVVSNGNLAASNENILKYCSTSNLRKINSEISLNEEKYSSDLNSWKGYSPFKSQCEFEADSGLQSLQVMKTILPKLHRSCSNLLESRENESDLPESKTWENVNSESNTFKVPYPVTKVTKISSPKFVDPPPSQLRSALGESFAKNRLSYQREVDSNLRDVGSTSSRKVKSSEENKNEETDVSRVSRIPTVKSVELKKNAFTRFSMPSVVPDYNLVSLSSYNRFERPKNVNRYSSSPSEGVNGTSSGLAGFKEQARPSYPFERSFSKENSTFSENHLKNSLQSSQLKSVILSDDRKSVVREPPSSRSWLEKNHADFKRESVSTLDRVREPGASKKFVGVPSPPSAFVMPKLKPASRREIKTPKKNIDSKDLLLDSIRSFGGISNLKKTGNVI